MQGEVPLAALDEMARILEGQLETPALIAPRETSRVIPVQVRGDHRIDLVGPDPEALQRVQQSLGLAQRNLPRPLLAQLGPDARLAHDDAPVHAGDESDARHVDHVVSVRRLLLLPQDLRHDAEHQPAIRLPMTRDEEVELEIAQLHGDYYAARMPVAAIQTSKLSKDYGLGHGLFDLDLEVAPQEVFGYLGPNGAGKSTTIRCLMGMIRPTVGSAHIFGLDCQRDSVAVKRKVGYLPGEMPQFGSLRGKEVVAYLGGLRGAVDPNRVRNIAKRFDLARRRRYREYSSGNKKKLGIVLAFMHKPDLLILDEPTGGLDPLNQQEFYNLLRETRDAGATVFLSSHILSEVEHVCDRVGIIRAGRLVKVAELDEIHHIRLHRLELEFAPGAELPVEAIRSAAGVEDVVVLDRPVTCTVKGNFDPLLKALNGSTVTNLVSHEPSLEEIFLTYYRPDATSEVIPR